MLCQLRNMSGSSGDFDSYFYKRRQRWNSESGFRSCCCAIYSLIYDGIYLPLMSFVHINIKMPNKNHTLLVWLLESTRTKIYQKNLSFMISICRTDKRRGTTRQKLESEETRVYAQTPGLKVCFKNSISGFENVTKF